MNFISGVCSWKTLLKHRDSLKHPLCEHVFKTFALRVLKSNIDKVFALSLWSSAMVPNLFDLKHRDCFSVDTCDSFISVLFKSQNRGKKAKIWENLNNWHILSWDVLVILGPHIGNHYISRLSLWFFTFNNWRSISTRS